MTADSTYPTWIFDGSTIPDPLGYGERAVKFIRALRHPKSGKRFQLDPWLERIVRRIYGPRNPDGTRIVRQVIMMLARGGRKTTLGAALALLHTIGPERVPHGQVVLAAYDRMQARIAFDEAVGFARTNRKIVAATNIRDGRHDITHRKSGAKLTAASSDAAAQNGRTPSFVLFDEIHAWKKRQLYDVLRTGLAKTAGTLSVVISQAGRGHETLAFEVFDYARKIARGEIVNETVLPILFETPIAANWEDEEVWLAANPGLSLGYPDLPALRETAREAKDRPDVREKFKNDHLCMWLENKSDPWIELRVWDEGAGDPIDLTAREGEQAWIGVDLGAVNDLSAVVIAFRDPDGGFTIVPYLYASQDSLRRRQERGEAPYQKWADDGALIATPGNVADYERIQADIVELCDRFNVQEIAMDVWHARMIMTALIGLALPAVEHQQGFKSMTVSSRAFERAVLSRKLRHAGHPVLRWCVGNVVIDTDAAGSIKPTKRRSGEKIDGAVAAIMAVGRAEHGLSTEAGIYVSEAGVNHGRRQS